MQFQCEACHRIKEYDPSNGQAMPSGWRMHSIGPSQVFLCRACGDKGNFYGGLSPYLRELLLTRGIDIGNE